MVTNKEVEVVTDGSENPIQSVQSITASPVRRLLSCTHAEDLLSTHATRQSALLPLRSHSLLLNESNLSRNKEEEVANVSEPTKHVSFSLVALPSCSGRYVKSRDDSVYK